MVETENLIHLSAPSCSGRDNSDIPNFNDELVADCQPEINDVRNEKNLANGRVDTGAEEGKLMAGEGPQLILQGRLDMDVSVAEEVGSKRHNENGFVAAQDCGAPIDNCRTDPSHVTGAKRARMESDRQNPSVHVMYNFLTRKSLRKLEELLQKWSKWHAQDASSSQDPDEIPECGEGMYFPVLHTGVESSSVSFWLDNQSREEPNRPLFSMDCDSVPLYDRGYALGLLSDEASGSAERCLEIVGDASRCFNCGSYSHSLKDCPKPRDNVAVNAARKQHMSKRNQNPGSRNPTRYYQNSPAGKYEGLRPGALDVGTRKALGLGELDPPPWLNRMREIGYPPGYLDLDQPSGILIYAGDEVEEEDADTETRGLESFGIPAARTNGETSKIVGEDGEILETPLPRRRMSVQFPGINAPIPEKADEMRWGAKSSSRNRVAPHKYQDSYEQRGLRDLRDERPPGVDPVVPIPTMSPGSYLPSYSDYGSGSCRRLRSLLVHEGSASLDLYGSSPYSSPSTWFSPRGYYGSPGYEYGSLDRGYGVSPDHGSISSGRYEGWRHRGRR